MLRPVDELAIRTRAYWEISSAFNDRLPKSPTTKTALTVLQDNIKRVNPARPIHAAMSGLNHKIIMGRPRKRKTPIAPDNLRQLRVNDGKG